MDAEKNIIRDKIELSGWGIAKLNESEWWINEMWRLDSGETSAFVAFLVDPANMELVWAVLATKEQPFDYAGELPRYVLPFERFDSDIGAFMEFLNSLSNKAA